MTQDVRVWGEDLIEPGTLAQARTTAQLPILAGPVALMPDAHVGIGATVGSVVATNGAIIPAAVGVDIGCGMIATLTNMHSKDLPDDLTAWVNEMEQRVPAGVGKGHEVETRYWAEFIKQRPATTTLQADDKLVQRAAKQFGSLGSGNHFAEVCLDESDRVWIVLHSGSRGVGKELAERHIKVAKQLHELNTSLPNPDLAWFQEGTNWFDEYILDLTWAQDYAFYNRKAMMSAAVQALASACHCAVDELQRVNCHHNYASLEWHVVDDTLASMWITRKGAIKAGVGNYGVIPGSMGAHSFIVRGKGNEASYQSCSHGAGRKMSRGQAKRQIVGFDFIKQMEGKSWQREHAEELIDEAPDAYKDINAVMAAQADLVEIVHELHQVANYKGVNEIRNRRR
jgi:RNA-splicing ligase RtcB